MTTGRKIGNPHLKWAFSEAITLLKRECPQAKAFAAKIEKKHNLNDQISCMRLRTAT